MKQRTAVVSLCTSLAIAALMPQSFAQDDNEGIEQCLDGFVGAFNARDNAGVQGWAAYPHVYSAPDGQLLVMKSADEFVTDFEQLAREKGWARTNIDSFEVVQRSPAKAHVTLAFSSYDASGNRYQTSFALWVLLKQKEKWTVQLRSWLGANVPDTQDTAGGVQPFLEAFFAAFNARDDAALQTMTRYPHVLSLHDSGLVLAEDASDLTMDFDELAQEGWHHSTLDSFDLVQHSAAKAHATIEFSRRDATGAPYHIAHVLYVLVKQDGRWGMQMRSLLGETSVTLRDNPE